MRSAFPRAVRCLCSPSLRQQTRCQSIAVSSSHAANSGTAQIASGVAGGVAAGAVLCSIDLNNTARMQTDVEIRPLQADPGKDAMPKDLVTESSHAMDYIKDFCYSHITWVPGGHSYLDTAFRDLDTLKLSHKEEVDQIVNDVYEELHLVSNAGFSFSNVRKIFGIFGSLGDRLGKLAGSASPTSTASPS